MMLYFCNSSETSKIWLAIALAGPHVTGCDKCAFAQASEDNKPHEDEIRMTREPAPEIAANLAVVRQKIEASCAAARTDRPALVAVSKRQPDDRIDAALAAGRKVAAIYRPLNNRLLSGLLERRQANYGGDIFRKGREAALGMVTPLRKGQVMCLLVDQQLREGMAVPFFGHPAQTSISHVKLAIKKRVPLIHMRTQRLAGSRFRVSISPPMTLPDQDDDDSVLTVATAINATIESWIRDTPEQWFWPHRRWGKDIRPPS